MKLLYNENTPEYYQPPFFKKASSEDTFSLESRPVFVHSFEMGVSGHIK